MGWIKYVKSTARWRGVFSSINHEHERKEGNAEDWAHTFSGESVWRRPRWDLFSCELCKFCPFPANGSAPHCITEHLYSSKWKKEQKDIGKEIFSIIQRAAGAKEYGVQQIVRQKVSVTQWWFFFPPQPRLYSFNLAKRMDCRDSRSEISQNEKQKWQEILLYKQVFFHVVVGGGAGSCFPRCCAVIAAFLFFCYLDLVPECDVATSVSQMISCLLGLPAWWRPAERKSSRLCCKTRKSTSKSFHLNC